MVEVPGLERSDNPGASTDATKKAGWNLFQTRLLRKQMPGLPKAGRTFAKQMVEVPGIEPGSFSVKNQASTCVEPSLSSSRAFQRTNPLGTIFLRSHPTSERTT